jgi:hypothetical protein
VAAKLKGRHFEVWRCRRKGWGNIEQLRKFLPNVCYILHQVGKLLYGACGGGLRRIEHEDRV